MIVENLHINKLRNHFESKINFSPGINVFFGENGAGKTTILEAISIAAHTKSFLPVSDMNLIKFNEDEYSIHLNATNYLGVNYKLNLLYQTGRKKRINNSFGENLSPKDIIGNLPIVILSPDFKPITFGAPSERRQFIDSILSQAKKIYIEHILDLKKCLKQRNSLLLQGQKQGYIDESLLDLWTESFIKNAVEITYRRNNFVNEFIDFFQETYKEISKNKEQVDLKYVPDSISDIDLRSKEEIHKRYMEKYQSIKTSEIRRGTTLFGPQKDELDIFLNKGLAKEVASQGQHKSLLISLKFAEFNYLKSIKQDEPVILLDDIFSELDDLRISQVLELISQKKVQTFITLTNIDLLNRLFPKSMDRKLFSVMNGIVEELDK